MSPAGIRRREPRRIDEARRVSSRERANQSNLRVETTIKLPTFWHICEMSPAGIEPTFKV
jgi:hypothetical protein